jgi:hypothetical protein
MYDYTAQKSVPIPDDIRQLLTRSLKPESF